MEYISKGKSTYIVSKPAMFKTATSKILATTSALAFTAGMYKFISSQNSEMKPVPEKFDTCVIGGGIVGLSVARELSVRGQKVILFEKNNNIASESSGANNGLACTGYTCDKNSLEAKLLRRSLVLYPTLSKKLGLVENQHIKNSGALMVKFNDGTATKDEASDLKSAEKSLKNTMDILTQSGETDVKLLNNQDLQKLEPLLSKTAQLGTHIENEGVVEPFLMSIAHAISAKNHGAEIYTNSKVTEVNRSRNPEDETIVWGVSTDNKQNGKNGNQIYCENIVNCTGLNGENTEKLANQDDHTPFEFKVMPEKAQYAVFKPDFQHGEKLSKIILPVNSGHEELGDKIKIYQNMYGNIVVGPTLEKRDYNYENDPQVVAKLQNLLYEKVPHLNNAKFIGSYSAFKPSTDKKDYIIERNLKNNWVTVANIKSTGLRAYSLHLEIN